MKALPHISVFAAFCVMLLCGCEGAPHGQPRKGSETLAPGDILDFATLYSDNCAACHGTEGRGGAANALADPVYLAVADDATIRRVVAKGVPGTAMPAFAQDSGGMLTNKQVDVISSGIRSHWTRPGSLGGVSLPSYAAKSSANAPLGHVVYNTFCQRCHGADGRGGPKGSNITDASFLALISDQGLRTIVITGRPELGAPDWLENVPGKPMSDQEITDVVAWLVAQRSKNPAASNSASNYAPH